MAGQLFKSNGYSLPILAPTTFPGKPPGFGKPNDSVVVYSSRNGGGYLHALQASRGIEIGDYVDDTSVLDYIVPDKVHVLAHGKMILSGDKSLALELEAKGYSWLDEVHG